MADETLSILVRLRNARQAAAEARLVAEGVDEIGDAADRTNRRTRRLTSITDNFGLTLNNVSGRLKLAVVAGSTLWPVMVALGSSLAGAAAGAALLGATGLGIAAVGIGAMGVVAKQAFGELDKLRSAQDSYNLAVEQFGRYSDEAIRAQDKLNAVMRLAGPETVRLAREVDSLSGRFRELTSPARRNLLLGLVDGLRTMRRLLPTITDETNATAASLRRDLQPAFRDLSGPAVQGGIRALFTNFRLMAGPAVQGAVDLLIVFLRIARQAGPWVVQGAEAFAGWARGLRDSSANAGALGRFVDNLVGHTRAWWGLTKALFGLLVSLFRASGHEGAGLVQTMTDGINRLSAWIDRAREAGSAGDFFRRFVRFAVQLATVIGVVAVAFMELIDGALPAVQSALEGAEVAGMGLVVVGRGLGDAIGFLSPLMGPLVVALVAWKVATLAVAAATTILNVAFRLTPLGWLVTAIGLVVAAVVLMWNKWGGFRRFIQAAWEWIKTAAGDVWGAVRLYFGLMVAYWTWVFERARAAAGWIVGAWGDVTGFFASLPGRLAAAGSGMWDWIRDGFRDAINWIIRGWNSLEFRIPGFDPPGPGPKFGGVTVGVPDIPQLAEGGTIARRGAAIVGDQGPELLELPEGARVTPLDPRGPQREVVRLITVDGRVLAEAVFGEVATARARG